MSENAKTLVEIADQFPYRIEENENGGMTVSGIYQLADVKNRNNRVYPRGLWERVLADGSSFRQKLQAGLVLGEMGHPANGKTRLSNVSHIIREVWMEDKTIPECVVCSAGGPAHTHVMAKEDVLDTPEGRILAELYRKGVQLGVSSRGSGSVRGGSDEQVVADDYKLETFDHVLDPSTPGAYPKLISESVLGAIEKLVSPDCKAAELQGYRRVLQDHMQSAEDAEVREHAHSLIEAIDTKLSHGLTEEDTPPKAATITLGSGSGEWAVPTSAHPSRSASAPARTTTEDEDMTISISNPEVKRLVDEQTQEHRSKAATALADADTLREQLKEAGGDLEAAKAVGKELETQLRNSNFQLETLKKHVEESGTSGPEMYDEDHTVAEALDAARSIIDELLGKADGLQEANETLSTRCEAAEKYISEVRDRERKQAVMDHTERVLSGAKLDESRVGEVRAMLLESASVQEVNRTWGRLAKLTLTEGAPASKTPAPKKESKEGDLPAGAGAITEGNKTSLAEGADGEGHDPLTEDEEYQSLFAAKLVEKMNAGAS
jgi:hypothetical protein